MPVILLILIVTSPVKGKSAVTTPELAALETEVAPVTEKKLAPTPFKVYPDLGLKWMIAVYIVPPLNGESMGVQDTVPVN